MSHRLLIIIKYSLATTREAYWAEYYLKTLC